MKEYCIYNVWNGGSPFISHVFSDYTSAKVKLLEMVQLEKDRNRLFFVDNDFFENEYHIKGKGKYFCIKEREVSEWKKTKELNENKNNNIFYICN